MHWLVGLVVSGAIAAFAWRRGSLSPSGAWAALAVGAAIYAGGGAPWFAALLVFFASSTALGRVGRAAKEATKREFEKGDRRDAWQVLANGGVAALAAVGALVSARGGWGAILLGALATANGDTWATELGTLSRNQPFSLTRLRRVPRGSSGAVSPLGLAATALGGTAIGVVAALAPHAFALSPARALVAGTLAGFFGSLADSLLGATVQRRYRCTACDRETEGPRHHCGNLTHPLSGFINNDAVNLLATLFGAAIAFILK